MKKQTTKTYISIVIILIVLVFIAGVYFHDKNKAAPAAMTSSSTQVKGASYTTSVSGYTLSLKKDGTEIQTLTLGEDATAGMNLIAGSTIDIPPFITDQDVNGDGYMDVAMLTGIGYGGVNAFYDYYVFDPATEKLVADPVLTQICNPVFDAKAKTITGDAKDAQDSYKTVYTFDGTKFEKGSTVSDSTGQIEDDTD